MRFHIGCSFSWKTIKKFLFPFILGILSYFFLNYSSLDNILGFIKVNALTNYNTQYNISIPNYDEYYSNVSCGSESIKDLLHNFIENYNDSSSLYYIIIFPNFINNSDYYSQNKLTFFAYKKSKTQYNRFSFYGLSSGNIEIDYAWNVNGNDTLSYSYIVDLDTCNSSISTSSSFQSFLSYINGNLTINSSNYNTYSDSNGHFMRSMQSGSPSADYKRFLKLSSDTGFSSFNNTESFTINEAPWYYWSSRTLSYKAVYTTTDFTQSSSKFYKNIYIVQNDTTYNYESSLVSFWDIKDNYINSTFIDYKSSLGTIYTNFSTSDFNNFNLKLTSDTLNITGYDYFNNLSYTWGCYGRVNHNNSYYTYEKFSYCDFEQIDNSSLTSNKLDVTFNNFNIYDSHNNIINDFSNYDKLFFYIDFQYKDLSIEQSISNLKLSFNGNIYYEDNFKGPIYEHFNNLSFYFKLLLSTTKQDYSYFYTKYSGSSLSDFYLLYKQQYNLNNLIGLGEVSYLGKDFQRLSINNSFNLGYLIYHQINSSVNTGIDLPSVDIICFEDVVISMNNISSNNLFYIDSTGNITNNDLNIKYDVESTNNYDLNYYFTVVYEYIESYKDKIWDFHLSVQSFYDSTPVLFQDTIYILFILLCITIIYKEIRR